jgi:hypothetical protein
MAAKKLPLALWRRRGKAAAQKGKALTLAFQRQKGKARYIGDPASLGELRAAFEEGWRSVKNPGAFKRCAAKVAAKGKARSPRAVCAAAGRKKLGQAEMTRRAVAGRKKGKRKKNNGVFTDAVVGGVGTGLGLGVGASVALPYVKKFLTGKKNGKRNPGEEAAAMYETFHGKPATGFREYTVKRHFHKYLANCGRLLYLDVALFAKKGGLRLKPRGVSVDTTETGGQLYFNADAASAMEVDLSEFGLAGTTKDFVDLGECFEIAYHTSKDFHDFEPTDYWHKFGEESGVFPTLSYDVRNRRLYLTGGNYQVKREGIVD